jgi:CRISPR-associated protein Cmr5
MSKQFLTREQRYANQVYAAVEKHISESKTFRDKYGSMAHKLPVLIRTAGLAQALAFVEARHKEGTAQNRLLQDLAEVLTELGQVNGGLAVQSRSLPFDGYMLLTEACIEALLWFKCFGSSLLDADITAGGNDE